VIGTVGTDNYGLFRHTSSATRHPARDGQPAIVRRARQAISIIEQKARAAGRNLRLTIDSTSRRATEKVLAGVGQAYKPKGATALVMDRATVNPGDGELAPVAPAPAAPTRLARQNRAVAAAYGTARRSSGHGRGARSRRRRSRRIRRSTCRPTIQSPIRTIKEAESRANETMTPAQILARSSERSAGYTIGLRQGKDRFDSGSATYGFRLDERITLPGEQQGDVLHPKHTPVRRWANMPFARPGRHPIQRRPYEAIANTRQRPPARGDGRSRAGEAVVAAADDGCRVGHAQGRAGRRRHPLRSAGPGYNLAGKTGTRRRPNPKPAGYSKDKYVASFIGYAAAAHPRLLVAYGDEPHARSTRASRRRPSRRSRLFALTYLAIRLTMTAAAAASVGRANSSTVCHDP